MRWVSEIPQRGPIIYRGIAWTGRCLWGWPTYVILSVLALGVPYFLLSLIIPQKSSVTAARRSSSPATQATVENSRVSVAFLVLPCSIAVGAGLEILGRFLLKRHARLRGLQLEVPQAEIATIPPEPPPAEGRTLAYRPKTEDESLGGNLDVPRALMLTFIVLGMGMVVWNSITIDRFGVLFRVVVAAIAAGLGVLAAKAAWGRWVLGFHWLERERIRNERIKAVKKEVEKEEV